ncbi:MAG TPA: CHRD domain-containing protein, partial [Ferruginibacter sp.]|nr:CHRD domain-containing protein [Ferruginibacter sp.]
MKNSFYAVCFAIFSAMILSSCSKSTDDLISPTPLTSSVNSGQSTGSPSYTFVSQLYGFRVVPTNSSLGKGQFIFEYSGNAKTANYELTWERLEPVSAHIHEGSPTENGKILYDLGNPITSPLKGMIVLTDDISAKLLSGKLYVDIHTRMFP